MNTAFEEFNTLLDARHSCRAFQPVQIADETIQKIVETAQKIPSWCNAQPWQLLITRADSTQRFRQAMTQAVTSAEFNSDIDFPTKYQGIYKDRRRECGWQLYEAVGVQKGDRIGSSAQMAENYSFFGAPHVAVVTCPAELGSYGILDCGAFVTAFTLAAASLGVASIAQAAIAGYSDQVRAHFEIEPDRRVLCAISFGLPDLDHAANKFRTNRADFDAVVDWR